MRREAAGNDVNAAYCRRLMVATDIHLQRLLRPARDAFIAFNCVFVLGLYLFHAVRICCRSARSATMALALLRVCRLRIHN
jgi:hypothetical protein